MVKSFNQPTSPIKLLDRLKQLGKCQYECNWVYDKNYYYNNLITSGDVPELIELATSTDYLLTEDNNQWCIPIHAWRLIGRLKIKEAIDPLVNTLNNYPDIDCCAHELPYVFKMLGKDAVEPLAHKLQDTSNTKIAQFLIVESMANITQANKSCRDYIIDIFADTLDFENKEAFYLNTGILLNLIRLNVGLGKSIIEDVKKLLEENLRLDLELYTEHISSDQNNDTFSSLPVSTQLSIGKIGRNDKCPCGSGKKYKKCCIDNDAY